MIPDLFSLREDEIFRTLETLKARDFVLIGGYAVNAYALPRFSVDCDIVVHDEDERDTIEKILLTIGYTKETIAEDMPYSGSFSRFEKRLENSFVVSVDVLIRCVTDRMTGVRLTADWLFENSETRMLKGKTIQKELELRIAQVDALLVMKIIACRATDIRDVFMMLPNAIDKAWIKAEVSARYDFDERFSKLLEKVDSKQFKDGLAGVYGRFDQKIFDKHRKALLALKNA